jgi:phenylalanyl-tRNA synthetase beta chain
VRPIFNVVDLTNLVMFEWGHPIHAFDLDRLRPAPNLPTISVRCATHGEQLRTLDDVNRDLTADDLVICDGMGPIALAGVMGGKFSEVTEATTRVLIEVAHFEPRGVRRTSRRFGLHSEASHRFERGVDPGAVDAVLASASAWMQRTGAAKMAAGALKVAATLPARSVITLRFARIAAILGALVPAADVALTLQRLGCTFTEDQTSLQVTPPTHRHDLNVEIDLIEEVMRLRGIDAVHAVLPAISPSADVGGREGFSERVRRVCIALGLAETILLGMTSPDALANVAAAPAVVALRNALSDRAGVMRTSLLPGLFGCITHAFAHGVRGAALFALGPVFLAPTARSASPELPTEQLTLAVVLAGERPTHLRKNVTFDVWDAKGLCELLVKQLTGRAAELRPTHTAMAYHPRGRAQIYVEDTLIGTMGALHPDVADRVDIAVPSMLIELNLDVVGVLGVQLPRYRALPRFPASSRDLALIVSAAVTAGDVMTIIREAAGELAEHVEVFDRFEGGQIPAGHVSLAFHVRYRLADRTLTDAEVDIRHQAVLARVEATFSAQLRS